MQTAHDFLKKADRYYTEGEKSLRRFTGLQVGTLQNAALPVGLNGVLSNSVNPFKMGPFWEVKKHVG
jgi:hypothetical protein